MSEFSAVQAGLYAFRRRERRFVLTGATFGYLIGACLIGAAFVAAAWPALSGIVGWYASVFRAAQEGGTPPQPSPAVLLAIAPWYGGYILATLFWMSVYEAACLRWMVRGETGGVLGLSVNGDTMRVLLTYVVWFLLWIVFCVLAGLFYGALIAINAAAPSLRILMMVLGALAPLGLLGFLLWVGTRLSPAAAASIAQNKFAFFAAWGVTRGRFWDLLGAFFVILAVYLAVGFLLQALMRVPLTQAMYPLMQEGMHDGDLASLMTRVGEVLSTPLIAGVLIGYVVVSFVLACVLRLAWFGVNAYAVAAGAPGEPVVTAPAPEAPPAVETARAPAATNEPQAEGAAPEGPQAAELIQAPVALRESAPPTEASTENGGDAPAKTPE